MGFFTDDELGQLQIVRMNFQIVGEETFVPRLAMRAVEQPEFFLGRIVDIDIGPAHSFRDVSGTRDLLQRVARGQTGFGAGALALARDFHSRHVGQSKPGAFFFFELAGDDPQTQFFAMLKYDYSEVLTLRRNTGREQLRRIVQAFVKDKRALQKSALVRVAGGVVEELLSVKDRAARSPDITDFFSEFLGVNRARDDIELNREAAHAIVDIARQAPAGTWPNGVTAAVRTMREALLNTAQISVEVVQDIVRVAAGRPDDEDAVDLLQRLTERIWRKRRLSGLEFRPDPGVLQVASNRRVRTVEHIKIEYPEALDGVRVHTRPTPAGGAMITIETARIESNEIVNESLSHIRRLAD